MSWLGKLCTAKQLLLYKSMLDSIIWPRQSPLPFKKRLLEMFKIIAYVSNMVRIVIIYADWKYGGKLHWIHFDSFYRFLWEFKIIDPDFLVFILLFVVFSSFLNYFFYYFYGKGKLSVLQCNRQLNLDNPRAIIEDNPDLLPQFDQVSKKEVLEAIGTVWKLVQKDDEQLLEKIHFSKPLPIFPTMSTRNRVNLFLVYLYAEAMFMLTILVVATLLFTYFFWNKLLAFRGTWIEWTVMFESIGIIILYCNEILRLGAAMMGICLVSTSAITFYYGQLNQFIANFDRKTRSTTVLPIIINYRLFNFYREHQRMCNMINLFSDHWELLFCVALWTNIPLNVNCFSVVLLSRRKVDETWVLFGLLVVAELIIGFISVYPAAYNATVAHRAGKYMVPLQPKISKLHLKLKWEHYHEIVHNSKLTIAYQASLFGRLTVFSMVKFALFYFEAVIFFHNKR